MAARTLRNRRPSIEELEEIRINRSNGIRGVLRVTGIIFLVLVSFLVSMLLLTPFLELYSLRQEKEHVEEMLRRARIEEEKAHNNLLWLEDPEYYEQIARDRANQAKEGEHIIRRPAAEEQPPQAPQKKAD